MCPPIPLYRCLSWNAWGCTNYFCTQSFFFFPESSLLTTRFWLFWVHDLFVLPLCKHRCVHVHAQWFKLRVTKGSVKERKKPYKDRPYSTVMHSFELTLSLSVYLKLQQPSDVYKLFLVCKKHLCVTYCMWSYLDIFQALQIYLFKRATKCLKQSSRTRFYFY